MRVSVRALPLDKELKLKVGVNLRAALIEPGIPPERQKGGAGKGSDSNPRA